MTLFEFLYSRRLEILSQTIEHLNITLVSLFFAILLGVALGILLSRVSHISAIPNGTLGVLGVIQTIPSLALLGFMLPILGIGAIPAIVALFLYALLPIVRNTYTGISEVDSSVKEAAKGIGLSNLQVLVKVELPLAIPIIFAGIRTAVVINVGVATLCALIAAGGLGEFIFRGISLNNANMILAGAIPAALLALFLDSTLALIQKYIQKIIKPVLIILSVLMFGISFNFAFPDFFTEPAFKMGFDAEFIARPDGYPGLKNHYDIQANIETLEFDPGLMYRAVKEGSVDLIGGYLTDGRIEAYNLRTLDDDKNYFPPYYVAPLVKAETLTKYPELEKALNKLAGKISVEKMRQLNYAVDGEKKSPKEVAINFLKEEGFSTEIERSGDPDIVIGGKKFSEQYILLEIFKILIENETSLKVELKGGLGGTQIAFEAIKKGEIDLYFEYTGTGLFAILKTEPEIYEPILRDKDKVYQYVKTEMQQKYNLVWLKPLGFNNTYTLLMKEEQAKSLNLHTISELGTYLNQSY